LGMPGNFRVQPTPLKESSRALEIQWDTHFSTTTSF
jgi:hypothetical protein